MDTIHIKGLEIFAYHGVYADEKQNGQHFIINADISVNTKTAGKSDDINDALDYGKLCEYIKEYMINNQVNLLETLTNELSLRILLDYPKAESLRLEIQKPEAPIPMKFDTVSVEVERKWHTSIISIGSNMGNRKNYLETAVSNLGNDCMIKVIKQSELIETKPYGYDNQDDFLNGVVKIRTLYSPEELLDRLHKEEELAQRERLIHWGPRTLDMDIVYYDSIIMSTDTLVIPHPDMSNRLFVLEPLCEIEPYMVHPRFMLTTKEMLANLETK